MPTPSPFFDRYAWQARILPAFVVLVPIALGVVAWVPSAKLVLAPVAAVVGLIGPFLLAHAARDAGKRVELDLVRKWGGMPTTRFLRHRDNRIDEKTKARYRARLQMLVPLTALPTARQEQKNPQSADEAYSSCASYLRAKTRDTGKYHLLFTENINYGFRRNLLGVRSSGLFAAVAGSGLAAWRLWSELGTAKEVPLLSTTALVGAVVLLLFWLFVVKEAWVSAAADEYALRLLETIDELDVDGAPSGT